MTEIPPFESGRPRHEQVSEWLRACITAGEFEADARLPSESELGRMFDVSRITVRRALATLESDGLIYRRQGLGSFVAPPKLPQGLVRLTDFAQDMRRAGLEPSSRVLRHAMEPAPSPAARALGIEVGSQVMRLDRLRYGDSRPVALDHTWLPPFYAQLIEGHDLTHETLYRILETEYEIPVTRGRYRIDAVAADPEIADVLNLDPGQPLLRIERTSFTTGERPVYYQHRFYRADRIAFELELERGAECPHAEGMPLRDFEPIFK